MSKVLKVIIGNEAKLQLRQLYNYIREQSLQNAIRVRDDIVAAVIEVAKNPEQHSPDKYKIDNDGSFRAFELHKYRIAYHVEEEQITVLRIRHKKMNPLEY